jgi:signal transduction histidine kinase
VTGLHEIETLIDTAGMPVALDRAGEPRRVPHVVERSAYRVVRDVLAGARRATEATVAIEYMPGALAVQVDHDGCGAELDEIAELAAALGGGLTASNGLAQGAHHRFARQGGVRVRVWLPTEGQPLYPAGLLAAR